MYDLEQILKCSCLPNLSGPCMVCGLSITICVSHPISFLLSIPTWNRRGWLSICREGNDESSKQLVKVLYFPLVFALYLALQSYEVHSFIPKCKKAKLFAYKHFFRNQVSSNFILLIHIQYKKKKDSGIRSAGAALGHVFLVKRRKLFNSLSSLTPSSHNPIGLLP